MEILNKEYLPMLDQLKAHFQENGQISLQKILTPKALEELQNSTIQWNKEDKLLYHKYSCAQTNTIINEILQNELFLSFLQQLTGKLTTPKKALVYKYTHTDFSLRTPCKPGILVIIDFGGDFPEGCGGDLCFAHEQDTATIPSIANSVTLIHVDEHTESFLTYITHLAGSLERKTIQFLLQ